jgi:hypothetical protein
MGKDEYDPLRRFQAEADEHLFPGVRFDDRLKERVLRRLSEESGGPEAPADPAHPAVPAESARRRPWFRRISAAVGAAMLAGLALAFLTTLKDMGGSPPDAHGGAIELGSTLSAGSPGIERDASGGAGISGEIADPLPFAEANDTSGNVAPSPAAAPICDGAFVPLPAAAGVPVSGENAADASVRGGPGSAGSAERNSPPADAVSHPGSAPVKSAAAAVLQGTELADVEAAKAWFGDDLLVPAYVPASFQLDGIRGYADENGEPAYVCFRYAADQRAYHIMQSRQQESAELPAGESVEAEEFVGVFAETADTVSGSRTVLHGVRQGIRFVVAGSLSREDALNVARSMTNGEP